LASFSYKLCRFAVLFGKRKSLCKGKKNVISDNSPIYENSNYQGIWGQNMIVKIILPKFPYNYTEMPTKRQATAWWFSLVSSSNKTDRHDLTEILLKVALNTITLTLPKRDITLSELELQ